MGNNTWVLADLHPDCKPLSCKWIFKRNLKYHKTTDCNETSLIIYIPSMDLKTTFLNGELDKEVYINQPQGFIMPDNENKLFGSYTDDAGSATQKTIPSTMSGYSSVVESQYYGGVSDLLEYLEGTTYMWRRYDIVGSLWDVHDKTYTMRTLTGLKKNNVLVARCYGRDSGLLDGRVKFDHTRYDGVRWGCGVVAARLVEIDIRTQELMRPATAILRQ
ncbi:zinc finger, CCHC-type containing protein [Tanacetum coccineum]|uniref:Zinc finger, CCHC-type containing protein n=1 Tax=Tanacetum coccineum TaxID=301880 RepID=A0ABQ5DSX7_9ASTR